MWDPPHTSGKRVDSLPFIRYALSRNGALMPRAVLADK